MSDREIVRILNREFPDVARLIQLRIAESKPILVELGQFQQAAQSLIRSLNGFQAHENRTLFVATILLLFSPETLNGRTKLRLKGLRKAMSQVLNISQPSISKQIGKARVFYKTYADFRDKANSLIQEVHAGRS